MSDILRAFSTDPTADTSVLYAHSGKLPLASRLSWRVRIEIYELFMRAFAPAPDDTILDIGVTCDRRYPESNFFERLYPHKNRITCVGAEDASHLERQYPGLQFVHVEAERPLPFPTNHFKVAFSNAVIEHAGSREQQRFFLSEIRRVSERFFLATPNRWFPIEAHTGLPFLHYLPASTFRSVLRHTRYRFWSDERNLNLLSRKELLSLFPAGAQPTMEFVGIGWGAGKSNLVAYGTSHDNRE